MGTPRSEVYKAIDSERDYQDQLWRRTEAKPVGEYLVLLHTYTLKAMTAWSDSVGDEAALEMVRKVAGIATRCMEENGAPLRVIPENLIPKA